MRATITQAHVTFGIFQKGVETHDTKCGREGGGGFCLLKARYERWEGAVRRFRPDTKSGGGGGRGGGKGGGGLLNRRGGGALNERGVAIP